VGAGLAGGRSQRPLEPLLILIALLGALSSPASAAADRVSNEQELRRAWANPRTSEIELTRDLALRACRIGDPIRESPLPIEVDGNGHTVRQTCFEKRVLRQDGTGFVQLEDIGLQRGGSDGPGAAITTRGEIKIVGSRISQNLAEEPGGAVFSMRKATVVNSVLTGNLANDDGGAVYARRGGVFIRDSILNGNLVDGSGGAIGSTGDIVVVRSHVDGNTTDGDGGALYADEDGDITVVESSVNGSTADGPGGAIFTLDGDVTIVESVLNGNRADDRGGAISGEADVTVIGSTIARNAAVAHVGGGIWSRGDLFVSNSTISDNYAEGQGGGILAAGDAGIAYSTISGNIAPAAANVAAGDRLELFGSLIGPAGALSGGQAQATTTACDAPAIVSRGYNWATDGSCRLAGVGDRNDGGDPLLDGLFANGGFGETLMPRTGSAVIDVIPESSCKFVPFGHRLEGEQHLAAEGRDPLAEIVADQRGAVRPFAGGCDVGSVEAGATVPARPVGPRARPRVPGLVRAPLATARARQVPPPATSVSERDSAASTGGIEGQLASIERELRVLERSTAHYRDWQRCIREVPVSEYGDDDSRFGYLVDELDGGGPGLRSALALDRSRRHSDYRFFAMSARRRCASAPTVPGGTAEDAAKPAEPPEPRSLGELERWLERLDERADRVERSAEHFDEWESCLSWVPVTEYGDPEQQFGYELRDGRPGDYGAAVRVDRSEWDDPDYEVLAFVGRDRPFASRECGGEPGESVDKMGRRDAPLRTSDRVDDLRGDADSLAEKVEDLGEPVEEFDQFDQCMFTLGMTEYGSRGGSRGYVYRGPGPKLRAALAMDMAGFDRAEYYFMAFPGEEPPQIECNEDASGASTDE
jgi:hypothetical protein